MVGYLSKILYLIIYAFFIIFLYYGIFNFHQEVFSKGYILYIIMILFVYILYRGYHFLNDKKEISFSYLGLFGYFLVHLFILSTLFFSYSGGGGSGFVLFSKIVVLLFLPLVIFFIAHGFGRKVLNSIPDYRGESKSFQFLTSLGGGLFVFITLMTLLGFAGFYNIAGFFGVLFILGIISYRELLESGEEFFNHRIIFKNPGIKDGKNIFEKINLPLLSSEFLFIIATFIIGVNLISILRPMPIGWDDMGAYMNFPNQVAAAGGMIGFGGMHPWEFFTGIGFLFSSGVQAFIFNSVGGLLVFFALILIIGDILGKKRKTFFNIPLFLATIYISMPMVIFHMAKDMKIDSGLFFFSIISLYIIFVVFRKLFEKEKDVLSKSNIFYILLAGIIAGFTFSMKVTSLLLILGIIGVVFYHFVGIAGFLGYFSLFIGIFTKLKLWAMMNIVVPTDALFVNNIFYISLGISFALFLYSFIKYKKNAFVKGIQILLVFVLGVGIGFAPWGVYNIFSHGGKISTGTLLSSKSESFQADYTKIYSQNELDIINSNSSGTSLGEDGTSSNEDWGRYFGYEKGINNYVKLPFNLTMQVNQKGEFTDITFLYLALLPLMLFLVYRVGVFAIFPLILSLIPLLGFLDITATPLTKFLGQFNLPLGYLILLLGAGIPFLYMMYAIKQERETYILKLNFVFSFVYIFLWLLSAFGVVWYGIVMYGSILIIFAFALVELSKYDEGEEFKNNIFRFGGSLSVLLIGAIYFFNSTFPHGMTNLSTAGYSQYKSGDLGSYEMIFTAQPTYFDILAELNINGEKQELLIQKLIQEIKNETFQKLIQENNIHSLQEFKNILKEIQKLENPKNDTQIIGVKRDAKKLENALYKEILYPSDAFKNEKNIYRIGTFLKYFVSQNYKRFYEDSLIFNFEKYFYSPENVDIGIERMKQIGIDYFLVDLNAATIDKDPAHNLTTRYENLLKTFTSEKLELIHTDSICLRIGLDGYHSSQKSSDDLEKYINIAFVNSESYLESGEVIPRGQKQIGCYQEILNIIQSEDGVSQERYSYLIPIVNYLNANKITNEAELIEFFQNFVGHGWMTLFKIKFE